MARPMVNMLCKTKNSYTEYPVDVRAKAKRMLAYAGYEATTDEEGLPSETYFMRTATDSHGVVILLNAELEVEAGVGILFVSASDEYAPTDEA